MSQTVVEIIRYLCISCGGVSAIITIIIILMNKMWKNIYTKLILTIQIFNLCQCIIDVSFKRQSITPIGCKTSAILFYFSWMCGNLFTALIAIAIGLMLSNRQALQKKYIPFAAVITFTLAATVAGIQYNSYTLCGPKDQQIYCGNCPQKDQFWSSLLWINYFIPIIFGIIAITWLRLTWNHLIRKDKSANKFVKKTMKIMYIPYIWLLFLLANGITIMITVGSDQYQGGKKILIAIANNLVMLTSVVNLLFFIYLIRKLNDIVGANVTCCTSFLIDRQQQLSDYESSMED